MIAFDRIPFRQRGCGNRLSFSIREMKVCEGEKLGSRFSAVRFKIENANWRLYAIISRNAGPTSLRSRLRGGEEGFEPRYPFGYAVFKTEPSTLATSPILMFYYTRNFRICSAQKIAEPLASRTKLIVPRSSRTRWTRCATRVRMYHSRSVITRAQTEMTKTRSLASASPQSHAARRRGASRLAPARLGRPQQLSLGACHSERTQQRIQAAA